MSFSVRMDFPNNFYKQTSTNNLDKNGQSKVYYCYFVHNDTHQMEPYKTTILNGQIYLTIKHFIWLILTH